MAGWAVAGIIFGGGVAVEALLCGGLLLGSFVGFYRKYLDGLETPASRDRQPEAREN